jgi:TPR repeat protein
LEADHTEAVRLFKRAAKLDSHALLQLAWCYEHGQGVGQDANAAVEQYRLAAEGGYALANASLGLCFEKGRGVPRSDPAEATRLYALAAEDGKSGKMAFKHATTVLPDSSVELDASSAGVLVRIRHAVTWLNLAARVGNVAAAQQLEALAGRRDVVSACCMGCGAVRKLKTCSKCCVARFCDRECSARMWPAYKASCKAWRAESAGSETTS